MDLVRDTRISEWWEHKVAPVCGVFYGTLYLAGVPVSASWVAALTLLIAIAAQATYVSVINDLTDREVDRLAGKSVRNDGRYTPVILLVLSIAAGACVAFAWRERTMLLTVYACGWVAFSLYSIPPFRFKERGIAGVLCDAGGAHLFPTLTAVFCAAQVHGPWVVVTAVWAFASGVRGILWHQLRDAEVDRRTGVRTFVVRSGERAAVRVAAWIALPVELVALTLMLWQLRSIWPLLALALYAGLMLLRPMRYGARAVIVEPAPATFVVMSDFNGGYLPQSILLASAMVHPTDVFALALHLLLFPRHTWQNVREILGLARLGTRSRQPS
jgi:4-hydroxybenzoate polyprenyltransferase